MLWLVLSAPLLGAFIGWITNRIAIRLLFYPRRPLRLPLLGWRLQGLLPRHQAELAESLGQVVEQNLLSLPDLWAHLTKPDLQAEVSGLVSSAVGAHLRGRLSFLPPRLREAAAGVVEEGVRREMPALWARLGEEVAAGWGSRLSLAEVVAAKVRLLDLDGLERMVRRLAARELRHIELLGGVLGFAIGLVQAAIFLLI